MRLAHFADLHITERCGESGATLDEQVSIMKDMATDASRGGAKVVLVAGDVFDRASTPAERNTAIEIFRALDEVGPVLVVRGNHDRSGDLDFLRAIRSHTRIFVATHPIVYQVERLMVACLPWPNKAGLVACAGARTDLDSMASDALRTILNSFATGDRQGLPLAVLGHLELSGATMDSGQPVAARADIPICAEDLLEVGADYYALGHIHKHQILDDRICYAGSPRQCNFGEDGPKGYCLVDVEPGKPPVIKHQQSNCRKLITVEAAWHLDRGHLEGENSLRIEGEPTPPLGAAVRLVYSVSDANRAAARLQDEEAKRLWLSAGVHSVIIDARTISTVRVRSEEIRTTTTTAEKLHAYWNTRGEVPSRADAITSKLALLESEVSP